MKNALVLLCCVSLLGCSDNGAENGEPPKDHASLAQANNAFAMNLYQLLKDDKPNMCFSPFGISSAIATVYGGARGETETEIARTMHWALIAQNLAPAFSGLEASVQAAKGSGVQISLTNSLWRHKGLQLDQNYTGLLKQSWGIAPREVNLDNTPAVAREINDWFRQSTKGKAKDVVSQEDLKDLSLMVCNVVHFKGAWQNQFQRSATQPTPFFIGKGLETTTVPMMYTTAKVRMITEGDFSALELPYKGGRFSMVLLLPVELDGLSAFEPRLTATNLAIWINKLKGVEERKTLIRIPKTHLRDSFPCADALSRLGMPSMFRRDKADLSGIRPQDDLYISCALHEVSIDVNEEGTEAVAATAVGAKSRSSPPVFNADHPFIFLIRENSTGTILFLGKISDPSQFQT